MTADSCFGPRGKICKSFERNVGECSSIRQEFFGSRYQPGDSHFFFLDAVWLQKEERSGSTLTVTTRSLKRQEIQMSGSGLSQVCKSN